MDRLVSSPVRDLSKFDGEITAYANKSRRICFNPCKGFNLLVTKHNKFPSCLSLPVATQF